MKIYVSVDMEGIAGIFSMNQIMKGEYHYEEARRLLTQEVNAVVEGLVQAGVNTIIVKDAHSSGYNFLIEQLHERAVYCMGGTPIDNRFPGIDSSFDGAMLIGYHAMAGAKQAILDHTYSIRSYTRVELNGVPIGEIALDSLLFGLHQVPVLLVTGDDKTCAEAVATLGEGLTTYQTKEATSRHSGLMLPPSKVNYEIKETVQVAVSVRDSCKPNTLSGPYELVIHFQSTDLADKVACDGIDTIRLDGLRVMFKDTDMVRLFGRGF